MIGIPVFCVEAVLDRDVPQTLFPTTRSPSVPGGALTTEMRPGRTNKENGNRHKLQMPIVVNGSTRERSDHYAFSQSSVNQ